MMTATTEVLGYIDKTIDNVIEIPATVWRSDEVVEMLRELRGMLPAVQQPNRDELVEAIRKQAARGQYQMVDDRFPYESWAKGIADAVLAALAVPATGEAATVEKLKVAATLPHPGGTSSAEFMRGAARNLERGYEVGGSGVTAAVVRVLRVVADAVEVTP